MNRALRAATMGALLLSPIALSACSAGQVAQTATQNRDKVGPEAAVGDLSMRQITLAHPQGGRYEEGDSAELQMAIVNGDTESDTLVGIEGEAFDGVVVSGQAAAVPTTPGAAPVATTPATPTTPGAAPQTTTPGTTPTPGTVPTPSVPAAPSAPTASSEVDIPIPAGSTVFLGGAGGATVELAELTEELTAGQSIELTLTFERAGEVTVQALVATPERVVPREEPFDFHHEEGEEGAEGGAEDIAREGESEAGSGPGEQD